MEFGRRGAEMLFQVLTEREEKNSFAIASNESFSRGTKTFSDPRLCAAVVDRLAFNGAIIDAGPDSYRRAHTKAQADEPEPAEHCQSHQNPLRHASSDRTVSLRLQQA